MRWMLPRAYVDAVVVVSFENCAISTIDLKEIEELSQLERLDLDHVRVEFDPTLATKLKRLSSIRITNVDSGQDVLSYLLRHPSVERVDIDFPVTDEDLSKLASLENLEGLVLRSAGQVTESGFGELRHAKRLRTLVLTGFEMNEACSRKLQECEDLSVMYTSSGEIRFLFSKQLFQEVGPPDSAVNVSVDALPTVNHPHTATNMAAEDAPSLTRSRSRHPARRPIESLRQSQAKTGIISRQAN